MQFVNNHPKNPYIFINRLLLIHKTINKNRQKQCLRRSFDAERFREVLSRLVELVEEFSLDDIDVVLVVRPYRDIVADVAGVVLVLGPGREELDRLLQGLGEDYGAARSPCGLGVGHDVFDLARDAVLDPRLVFELTGIDEVRELITAQELVLLDRIDLAFNADHEICFVINDGIDVAFQRSYVDGRAGREYISKLNAAKGLLDLLVAPHVRGVELGLLGIDYKVCIVVPGKPLLDGLLGRFLEILGKHRAAGLQVVTAASAAQAVCEVAREFVRMDFLGGTPYGELDLIRTLIVCDNDVDVLRLHREITYDTEDARIACLRLDDEILVVLVILIVKDRLACDLKLFERDVRIDHLRDYALVDDQGIEHVSVERVRYLGVPVGIGIQTVIERSREQLVAVGIETFFLEHVPAYRRAAADITSDA